MKIKKIKPPRKFQVGRVKNKIFIKDVAQIKVKAGEKVNINNNDINVEILPWGFLIKNELVKKTNSNFIFAGSNENKIHLLAFNKNKKDSFFEYCKNEKLKKIPIKKII